MKKKLIVTLTTLLILFAAKDASAEIVTVHMRASTDTEEAACEKGRVDKDTVCQIVSWIVVSPGIPATCIAASHEKSAMCLVPRLGAAVTTGDNDQHTTYPADVHHIVVPKKASY